MNSVGKTNKKSIEAYICVGLLAATLGLIVLEVFARYIFGSSISWSEELARYLFIWFTFISAGLAVKHNAHIFIDPLSSLVPRKVRPYSFLIGKCLWLIFSIFVVYLGLEYSIYTFSTNSQSAAMGIPMGLVFLGIPIGYLFMAIRLMQEIIIDIKKV